MCLFPQCDDQSADIYTFSTGLSQRSAFQWFRLCLASRSRLKWSACEDSFRRAISSVGVSCSLASSWCLREASSSWMSKLIKSSLRLIWDYGRKTNEKKIFHLKCRDRIWFSIHLTLALLRYAGHQVTCRVRKWFSLVVKEWLREGVFSRLPPRTPRARFFSLRVPCWWRRILSICSSTLILGRLPSAVHSCCSAALRGRSWQKMD